MAAAIKERFFLCALWPLNNFLIATGVLDISIDQLIRDVLMIDAIRLIYLVFDAVIHISLVFSIWPSVNLYLETLESVDFNLGSPKLSHLKRYSLVGLANMLFESYIKLFANHWFSVVPVWIYYICGQLHVFYVQKMVVRLNLLNELSRNTTTVHRIVSPRSFTILRSLTQLYSAAELLHHRFSTMLMINSCSTLISMFSASYYLIESFRQGDMIMLCRDSSDMITSFIRFWLMCHTADRIREAAAECIPILRELRDHTAGKADVMASTDRVTSFIIEISQLNKNGDRQSLYGSLPLSKRLIIPTMEIIFTYLIIIYQFKDAAH
ncbi:hypothetical protein OUZ56_031606 [Daphnia magna]|uniref:Gustatory receptor n=1 Tax=Daphnia magna TaxID=35525 RepID=A0ABQ9ZVS4_9CRUS|nr:hypothetical protein OUZ56_031606 [Daphnia magna]